MVSEDVVVGERSETAVSTIVKAPTHTLFSVCKSLFAGGVAGGVSRTAVAPLERLKILLQVQNPHSIKYSGTVQRLKYIWRTEGLRGLFKGNGTNCARIVPNSAVKFFSYEEASKGILGLYRHQTGKEDAELTPLLRVGAGACAGIIAMSATYPMDLVRGRLTVQSAGCPELGIDGLTFYPVLDVCRPRRLLANIEESFTLFHQFSVKKALVLYTKDGFLHIPYVGLNFSVYESLKDWLIKTRPFGLVEDSELSVTTKLACGAAAGTVGQTVAYPLDVIRRRMQMVGWKDAASLVTGDGKSKAPLEYSGMVDAFRKTVRHEGFRALYKGLVPNSVKVVPSIAIAFVTYEAVKDVLGVEMKISD
ncbi:unnamed protein product [Camellia sinensis]